MTTRSEKFTAHKAAAAFLRSQPATTARQKGIHLVTRDGRLMATIEYPRVWGGRKSVKKSGGKTITSTVETLAALKVLNQNAAAYFSEA